MISKQDIMIFSREFGLRPDIVEKDYVLGWTLAGIFNHPALRMEWVFKGGTCLKKCFFETYRFSEDLDFTIIDPEHLDEAFLSDVFKEIAAWIYEQCGIEIPDDTIRFEVYENPRGHHSVQGRIGYRGPLQPKGALPRIKLDLTHDEILSLDPVIREVHHPYPDRPDDGIYIQCYAYEELFAEKVRALAERSRPRDLYDVIHLYRNEMKPDRDVTLKTLEQKCSFKGVAIPTMSLVESRPERVELETEWENMLAHQLPSLPPFEQFWRELPEVFEWLHGKTLKAVMHSLPRGAREDSSWHPPTMAQPWSTKVPLEIIRFAAANRLCVNLAYKGSKRLIEPYSLRRTQEGNLLLHTLRHDSGEHRAYRVDQIEDAVVTQISFTPKYAIELTPSGPISAPTSRRISTPSIRPKSTRVFSGHRRSIVGTRYVIECPYCGKRFNHTSNNTTLNRHKDKQGYPCPGRRGYLFEIR